MELNTEQQEFFRAMETTFETSGWALLEQGWTAERDALYEQVFFNAKDVEDIRAARVRFGILNELIELPRTTQRTKDETMDLETQEDE
jgi:hypothetical protein